MNELLLYTTDTRRATDEIERLGGQVRHVFTPRLLVAAVPDGTVLTASSTEPPATVDDVTRQMAEAWSARSKRGPAGEVIPWDTPGFKPPR